VNLPDGSEFVTIFKNIQKTAPVLCDIFRRVFIVTGQIQGAFGKVGNPAGPRRKAVDETFFLKCLID
jgi:hypothetical protein